MAFDIKEPPMKIRKAAANEMLALWEQHAWGNASPTAKFFAANIHSGNADFWTIEHDDRLIAELYAFKSLEDTDYADGRTRAYLCAFRVTKEYRGQGLGSRLMEAVFSHLKDCGFTSVTIGVDETEEDNQRLYRRLGFNTKIKDCYIDPCDVDEMMKPKSCSCYWLLCKELT